MKLKKFGVVASTLALALAFVAASAPTHAQDKTLSIWTKYNDKNTDANPPATDLWMAQTIKDYAAFSGVTLVNTFYKYDVINSTLNTAVQAGGVVPDVAFVDSQALGLNSANGNLQDLTEWAKAQPWFADIDPSALAACTAPDGKILCIPSITVSHFTYYWKSLYPNGYPATTDDLLKAAEALKKDGKFALTFKGSEGASVERFYFPLIASFGGSLADQDGKANWANDGAVKAVSFVRELVQNKYVPETVLTGGFDFEEAFKKGESGGFVAGTYSYVYLTPIQAPTGEMYDKAPPATGFDSNAIAVGDAFDAGKLGFAPPLSAPGGKPYTLVASSGWGIPTGAKDVEGAKAFIAYETSTAINVAYAGAFGALPALKTALTDKVFSTAYWQAASKYQADGGLPAPAWTKYDDAVRLLSTAIVNSVSDPSKDILTELQKAQDEYNALIS